MPNVAVELDAPHRHGYRDFLPGCDLESYFRWKTNCEHDDASVGKPNQNITWVPPEGGGGPCYLKPCYPNM